MTTRDFLPEGRVFLYRPGSYRPELEIPANQPGPVPAGTWYWLAEAPGFVSQTSGLLKVSPEGRGFEKTIVWPMVPACELTLVSPEDWRGEQRLDLVSLEAFTLIPVPIENERDISARKIIRIPAGPFLAYTVDATGISALSGIRTCRAIEPYSLPRPRAPGGDVQSLVAPVQIPASLHPELLVAWVEPTHIHSPMTPIKPLARTISESRVTFFFLDLPAEEPLRLQLSHPELLTAEAPIDPLGGTVQELAAVEMKPRPMVTVPIDYRPAREHETQEIVISRCGARPVDSITGIDRALCSPAAEPLPIEESFGEYSFLGLDTGQFVVDALIDNETVPGLAEALVFIDSDSPSTLRLPIQKLEELHVYGHLLLDGEPVAGEVRLAPATDGSLPEHQQGIRRFPTDDDLLYHLYYFGSLPDRFGLELLPTDQASSEEGPREPADLSGLYYRNFLQACDSGGSCKVFSRKSTLVGGGRLDLELGSERVLRVQVVDRESQEPIVGAAVVTRASGHSFESLHFFAGSTTTREVESREPIWSHTDAEGRVSLRDLQPGINAMGVNARGYEAFSDEVVFTGDEAIDLVVELSPETTEMDPSLPTLFFPNQLPVRRAFLVGLDLDGEPDFRCATTSDARGQLSLPEACATLPLSRYLLLHPDALLQELSESDLRLGSRVEVAASGGTLLRIRLLDPSSRPLPNVPISLRYPSSTVGPELLTLAASFMDREIPFRTDLRGELTLRILDPRSELPRIFSEENLLLALVPGDFGRTISITLE